MRWIWRRWAWAVLTGVLVAATATADNPGKSRPQTRPGVGGHGRPPTQRRNHSEVSPASRSGR